jgi:hypothetical protein
VFHKKNRNTDRKHAFQEVYYKHKVTVTPSQHTGYICRADIAAADIPNVYPRYAPGEIASWDRPEQVTHERNSDKCKDGNQSMGSIILLANFCAMPAQLSLCNPFLVSQIEITAMSAGVIPLMRAA